MNKITSGKMLLRKLQQTLFKQRLVLFISGLLITGGVMVLTSLILSIIAGIFILPVGVKITLLSISGLVTVFFFGKFTLYRFFSGSIESVAIDLETKHTELKGRLIAAIQFAQMGKIPGYSKELIAETEKQALQNAGLMDFNRALSFYTIIKTGKLFVVSALLAVAALLLLPGLFSYSFEVYSHPAAVIAPPLGYKVMPFPGSVEWVKYRDIEIGANIFGDKLPGKATIHHRLAGGSWQETEVDLHKGKRHNSLNGDSLTFSITLRQINKSFDYYIEAGRVKTEIQKVDVVDRPRVTGIKLSLFYPSYTKQPPSVIDENNGSFSAVVGTRVNMKISTNLPVKLAELVFTDSSRTPLRINNREAEVSLQIDKSRAYYIYLTDHLGEKNPDPIEYYVTAVPDEFPSIDVIRPGFDVNLNDEMMLPLKVRIFDDYGFSSLVMKYIVVSQGRRSEEHVAVLHFSDRIKTEGEVEFNWDMDKLNLFPGDFVGYYFEVADNDNISGPKISRSRQFIARLPSLEEIVEQTEGESARRIINTEKIIKTGKELSERLKNVSRKIQSQDKKLKQAEWQNQKELETILDKNNEMFEEIEKLAEQMDKSINELNEKALLSREVLEKMAQIQKLFEEIATPEMIEAQKKLMEAIRNMNPKEIEDALKNFQMSQEELMQRLERTLALLKKMQLEQKMEAMIRQVEQLAKQQENMNEKTDSSSKSDLPNLSREENDIKKDLEKLKGELDNLKDIAKQAEMEQSSEFKKFKEALEKNDADANMQKMASSLKQQQQSEASQQGKKALSKLMQMLDTMQQQLMAMKGEQDDAVKKAMRMAMDDANYLSQSQEDLYRQAATLKSKSMMLRDMASTQQDIAGACAGLKNRINELAKQSPFIAVELQQLMNKTNRYMEMAMQEFDSKKGTRARRNQREAMTNLNKVSLRLMESLNQQKQCKKGGSCNKNTSQLQSLCNKQNQLNQQTQQECNKPGPNMKPGGEQNGREALKRLAGEQGSIRKTLEELNNEFGGSRQVLGRLDDIAAEMKKIEESLATGDVGTDIVERQLKIYSRMLEASRSLYRKDFSEQRQSKSAGEQKFYLPPELSSEILNDKVKLEDRLRQYLNDNYPPQYEEQIKAYFKALLQAESNFLKQNNNYNELESAQ